MHAHVFHAPILDLLIENRGANKTRGILPANSLDEVILMCRCLRSETGAALRSAPIPRAHIDIKGGGGSRLPTSDPESVHQILMARVVFLGAQPDPNTITSNKQQFCFNHKSNVYMINAIYSDLISPL